MAARDLIFVLGTGRSGSSAFTRVLSLCGGTLPQAVFGADIGNPRGFWEPVDAAKLNLEFSLQNGWIAGDPGVHPQGRVACDDSAKQEYIRQIREFLASCPDGPLLVIKEPLINELTEFWFEAARREGIRVKVVILIRHPHEVFESWAAFVPEIGSATPSLERSIVWWLRVNLIAERHTRNFPRVFIEHSNLISNWQTEVTRVEEALSVELEYDETVVDAFLTRSLHRQRRPGPITDAFGFAWPRHVYEILSAATRDAPIDVPALDEIYLAFSACRQTQNVLQEGAKANLQAFREYFARRPIWLLGRDF